MTTPTKDRDPKPCPFCGNTEFDEGVENINEGIGNENGGEATPWFIVLCRTCGVRSLGARDMDDAIAAWNRRAASQSEDTKRLDKLDTLEDAKLTQRDGVGGETTALWWRMPTALRGRYSNHLDRPIREAIDAIPVAP